ncbi:MAG: hypothetical protein ACNI3H_13500 [Halarcobacter ebronensis]
MLYLQQYIDKSLPFNKTCILSNESVIIPYSSSFPCTIIVEVLNSIDFAIAFVNVVPYFGQYTVHELVYLQLLQS